MRGHSIAHWADYEWWLGYAGCRVCLGSVCTVLPEPLKLIRSKMVSLIGHCRAHGSGLVQL